MKIVVTDHAFPDLATEEAVAAAAGATLVAAQAKDPVRLSTAVASVSAAAVHRLRTTVATLAVAAPTGGPLPSIVNGVPGPRIVSA